MYEDSHSAATLLQAFSFVPRVQKRKHQFYSLLVMDGDNKAFLEKRSLLSCSRPIMLMVADRSELVVVIIAVAAN